MRPHHIKLSETNAVWCIDDRTPSAIERFVAGEGSNVLDGLDMYVDAERCRSTINRSDACRLAGRLAAVGFTNSPIPCDTCNYEADVAADLLTFNSQEKAS